MDCIGEFETYGNCSTTCGAGVRTRTFTVLTGASWGGEDCDFEDLYEDVSECVDVTLFLLKIHF